MKQYFVYILASKKNGTLYVGVTNNLLKRVYQHKNKLVERFTKKYNVDKLVYFEETTDIGSAIEREKTLKRWKRNWKLNLIKEKNPDWNDLLYDFVSKEDIEMDSCSSLPHTCRRLNSLRCGVGMTHSWRKMQGVYAPDRQRKPGSGCNFRKGQNRKTQGSIAILQLV